MGKGGVGKTTMAAAVAVALAARGHAVHLTTTDPAAHLEQTLGGGLPSLTVSRIDPKAEVAAYAAEVMATAGAGLDEDDRRLLEEDLRSPCTEEIAVFRAFAAEVERGGRQFVVLDTAPTGHTLLLLDATEAYHREVVRNRSEMPEPVRHLLPRLRDPAYSKVLIVTLPEYTPVHEAASLQEDLRRAGIEPHAWIINQSLRPLETRDPLLAARRRAEMPHIAAATGLARAAYLVGWQLTPLVGEAALAGLTFTHIEEHRVL
jgi:arsenite-transporting ATPase